MKQKAKQGMKQNAKQGKKPVAAQNAGRDMKHGQEPKLPGEWLYFLPGGRTVREIADILTEEYRVEIWEEAGVLEIEMGEGSDMDLEAAEIHPKDEATRAFAEKHGCNQVFLVTFLPEDYGKAEKIMYRLMAGAGGFFCGDTEEFLPVVRLPEEDKK